MSQAMNNNEDFPNADQWTAEFLKDPTNCAAAMRTHPEKVFNILTEKISQLENAPPNPQPAMSTPLDMAALVQALQTVQQPAARPSKSAKLPDPEPFDGKAKNLPNFLANLNIKLTGNRDHFLTDYDKVCYSHTRLSPTVTSRMRAEFRCFEDETCPPVILTMDHFINKLKYYFDDPARVQKANEKLLILKQRSLPFDVFFAEFEQTLQDSSYANDVQSVVPILDKALSRELKQSFISSPPPKDYTGLVQVCKERDTRIQQYLADLPNTQFKRSNISNLTPRPAPVTSQPFPTKPPVHRPVSQGGSVMDLDTISKQKGPDGHLTAEAKQARRTLGRCLRCNTKGHMAIACPLGQPKVLAEMLIPEDQDEQEIMTASEDEQQGKE